MKEQENKPAYKKNYIYMAYRGKEYMWLAFAVLSVCITIYQLATNSTNEETLYFVALTFISGLFYSFNRYRRIKFEKREMEESGK